MSILCNDLIVRAMKKHTLPHEILTRVNMLLVERLNKSGGEEMCDGMDVGVALIDYDTMTVSYSGAMNEAVLLTSENNYTVLKANRKSLGKCFRDINFGGFELDTIPFKKGDVLYLFTDGYKDQFNREGVKIGKKQFLNTLSSIYTKSIEQQDTILNDSFQAHKKGVSQVDDVLVLGVKL